MGGAQIQFRKRKLVLDYLRAKVAHAHRHVGRRRGVHFGLGREAGRRAEESAGEPNLVVVQGDATNGGLGCVPILRGHPAHAARFSFLRMEARSFDADFREYDHKKRSHYLWRFFPFQSGGDNHRQDGWLPRHLGPPRLVAQIDAAVLGGRECTELTALQRKSGAHNGGWGRGRNAPFIGVSAESLQRPRERGKGDAQFLGEGD